MAQSNLLVNSLQNESLPRWCADVSNDAIYKFMTEEIKMGDFLLRQPAGLRWSEVCKCERRRKGEAA